MEEEILDTDGVKKKKRRGKKRAKRSSETSSERNLRSRISSTEKITENTNSKYPFILNLNVDRDVRLKVSRLLDNIDSGSNSTFMTPLCKSHGQENLLVLLDNLFKGNQNVNAVLMGIERNQRDKVGSRSIALPWSSRKSGVYENFKIRKQINQTLFYLPDNKSSKSCLTPITLDKAILKLKNNTNSGLPFFTKKGIIKHQLLQEFDTLLGRKDPCLCFTRTQEGNKTRTVWGFPVADSLNEMRYYPPLLEFQKKLPWRTALKGSVEVDKRITSIIIDAIFRKRTLISVDFSAYDASVHPKLQQHAFNYIKYLFQNKYSLELDYINERFTNINMVTPDGILSGEHGVPSGSVFTNEIDSIVQFLVSRNSNLISSGYFEIQGDDGVYSIQSNKVSNFLDNFKLFDLNVNDSKSVISKNYVLYLQNLYHIDYIKDGLIGGIYPIYRALNRLLYQERFSKFEEYSISGEDYFTIRAISILENCKFHPLFNDFVNIIIDHDRNNLIPTQEGIVNYNRMLNDDILTEGVDTDDIKGLKKFETYKIIMNRINKAK